MKNRIPIRLKGIVIAADWGSNGKVQAVDIAGCDEKRYRVADNPLGRQMLEYPRARVSLTGTIDRTTDPATLFVDWFRLDDGVDEGFDDGVDDA